MSKEGESVEVFLVVDPTAEGKPKILIVEAEQEEAVFFAENMHSDFAMLVEVRKARIVMGEVVHGY